MSYIVAGRDHNDFFKLILIKIIEFGLFFLRNNFLVGAALFIFGTLVIIAIFFQDELSTDIIGEIILFLQSMPIIGERILVPDETIHIDGSDLSYYFLRASFYLTVFTECVRYISLYVFKKDVTQKPSLLGKRIIFALIGITVIYSFSFVYVAFSAGKDLGWFLLIFFIFWIICCVATVGFLLIDFVAKRVHVIIDRINTASINMSQ